MNTLTLATLAACMVSVAMATQMYQGYQSYVPVHVGTASLSSGSGFGFGGSSFGLGGGGLGGFGGLGGSSTGGGLFGLIFFCKYFQVRQYSKLVKTVLFLCKGHYIGYI